MKPLVFVAILAKQKEALLQAWLDSLEAWDYPKDRMIIYIRANNSTDRTNEILKQWVKKNERAYKKFFEDYSDVDTPIQNYGVHEWNAERFKVLGKIRNDSIRVAQASGADYYFVCDIDNFLLPHTLSNMVDHGLTCTAPLLRYAVEHDNDDHKPYSNYHNIASPQGYYQDNFAYYRILNGEVRGLIKCDVVHCTYLLRKDILDKVAYVDDTDRYEYVIFSDTLRKHNIPQYLDNTEVYGYLTLTENLEAVTKWMGILNEARNNRPLPNN